MASIFNRKDKGFYLLFYLNGVRKTISFSSKFIKESDEIKRNVERLLSAIELNQSPDKKTFHWLCGASSTIKEKLAKAGLITIEKKISIKELIDEYLSSDEYFSFKKSTQQNKANACKRVLAFFNPTDSAIDIPKTTIQSFIEHLDSIYTQATRAGTIRDIRRVYNWAIEKGIVNKNAFNGIQRGSFKNKSREHYVSIEDYEKLLDACPNQSFRALIALYRIGALRKEEALLLKWSDVDFETGRLTVHSPKTERYKGRETRIIPLFPRLRIELEQLYETENSGYIIKTNRTTTFKRLEKIVLDARLERWERLIQNFRSSRSIEVYRDYGTIAESEWIGHSEKTAIDHYLHLLNADYEKALNEK